MLLHAEDEDGTGMTDRQLRDEVMTLEALRFPSPVDILRVRLMQGLRTRWLCS